MAVPAGNGPRYEVHCSRANADELRRLQDHASDPDEKKAIASAFRQIVRQLQRDPHSTGDPNYRLPAYRLEIRTCVVRPLVVYFAVHEDRPLVFIKGVKLL